MMGISQMYPDVTLCIQAQQRVSNETNIGDFSIAACALNRVQAHAQFRRKYLHREPLPSSCPVLFAGIAQQGADHTGV